MSPQYEEDKYNICWHRDMHAEYFFQKIFAAGRRLLSFCRGASLDSGLVHHLFYPNLYPLFTLILLIKNVFLSSWSS
jgi:hypothetical protein